VSHLWRLEYLAIVGPGAGALGTHTPPRRLRREVEASWRRIVSCTKLAYELRQKFSEFVRRAGRGERIGITKRGRLIAEIGPPSQEHVDLKQAFARMDKIRKKVRPHPGVTTKDLIEEGRR